MGKGRIFPSNFSISSKQKPQRGASVLKVEKARIGQE
jgi:hypothetical protein